MVENLLTLLDGLLRPPIVKHVGGEQGDPAVMAETCRLHPVLPMTDATLSVKRGSILVVTSF